MSRRHRDTTETLTAQQLLALVGVKTALILSHHHRDRALHLHAEPPHLLFDGQIQALNAHDWRQLTRHYGADGHLQLPRHGAVLAAAKRAVAERLVDKAADADLIVERTGLSRAAVARMIEAAA